MAIFNNSSVFLTLLLFTLLLNNNIINVKSESFSFSFPRFKEINSRIELGGGATISGGALQLTKVDNLSNPLHNNAGLAAFFHEVQLYNPTTRSGFNFSTDFTFVVQRPSSSKLHGDGMTFFLASTGYNFPFVNSSGGFLGLFTSQTAFNQAGRNKIVFVEFDSFNNQWDPNPGSQSPHIGINLGSIRSDVTESWPSDVQPNGQIARATVGYDSDSLRLSASVSYPGSVTILMTEVDLTKVLPERVYVGFSAATGDLVETHQVLSWDFSSTT
ncbi:hypothetical protein QN277_028519 [Acacia crassicarpa]|uniref:Legume lectin domain-containing protein n=1 Tax=Acacia crassicarpa TaxID=499986 RepID=A0AAE1J614_9FABA|nr:hypothetical protein QN277_028519 [Acacia crassicarpa]